MSNYEERFILEERIQREDRSKMLERNKKLAEEKEARLRSLGKNYVFNRKENTIDLAPTKETGLPET